MGDAYIAPVYIYQCRECDKVWHADFAAGFGGPLCMECSSFSADIIAKNYKQGRMIVV